MDDDFFAVSNPPAEEPPVPPADSGEAFLGDVNEADANAFAAPGGYTAAPDAFAAPQGDAYAAPPADDNPFAAPPADDNAFAAPPAEGAPIILGAPPPDAAVPIAEAPAPIEPAEPSPMQKWNEEWQETLKSRKDEENSAKAAMLEQGRLDLETFQKERAMKREARIAKNREDEQAKLEAIEADLENDNSWQRICKMVELQHDSTEKAEDVKRMRDVMIALKNDGARAEVLGA